MFDDTDWTYFFFRLALSGLNTVRSIFVTYCVANTIAPGRTKQTITNIAWFAIEMYTVVSMSATSFISRKSEALNKILPKSFIAKEDTLETNLDEEINFHFKNVDKDNYEDTNFDIKFEVWRKGKQVEVSSNYLNHNNKNESISNTDNNRLFKKVNYKLLSCSVFKNGSKLIDIDLSEDNGFGDFYSEGNILLDRWFLKFYSEKCIPKKAKELINMFNCDYEVKIIDNNADFHVLNPNQYILIGTDGITCSNHNPPISVLSDETEKIEFNNKQKTI